MLQPVKIFRLDSIVLHDIGPFEGEHFFDFSTFDLETIILVGGPMATGKTFLAKAICWALGSFDPFVRDLDRRESVNADAVKRGISNFKVRTRLRTPDSVIERELSGGAGEAHTTEEQSMVHLINETMLLESYEEYFYKQGWRSGRSAVLLFGLNQRIIELKTNDFHFPLLVHDVFNSFEYENWSRALEVLATYPGQVIVIQPAWTSRDVPHVKVAHVELANR